MAGILIRTTYYTHCKEQMTASAQKTGTSTKDAVLFSVIIMALFLAASLVVSKAAESWLIKSLDFDSDLLFAVNDVDLIHDGENLLNLWQQMRKKVSCSPVDMK